MENSRKQVKNLCKGPSGGDSLVIISGPLFSKENPVIFNGVQIPQHVFRIEYEPGKHLVSAWILPNNDDLPRDNLDSYRSTVEEIENLTGYHFLQEHLNNPTKSMKKK